MSTLHQLHPESPAVRELTMAVKALLERLVLVVQREAFQEAEQVSRHNGASPDTLIALRVRAERATSTADARLRRAITRANGGAR